MRTIMRYVCLLLAILLGFLVEQFGMHLASVTGLSTLVHLHLYRGGSVHSTSNTHPFKGTPLYTAALYGNVEVAKILLKEGADVNQMMGGKTPLYAAAFGRYTDMVVLLLQNGASVDLSGDGKTPLVAAALNNHPELVHLLIQHGADPNLKGPSGITPLMAAVLQPAGPNTLFVLRALLDEGAHIDTKGAHDLTPLFIAVMNNEKEVVSFLIQNKANLDLPCQEGKTALHEAVLLNRIDLASMLLAAGARTDIVDSYEQTPLLLAVERNHLEMVTLLLNYGVSVHQSSPEGYTSIIMASSLGYLDMISLLLQRGASVVDENLLTGRTPLMMAAAFDRIQVMEKLLPFAAKVDHVGRKGETALIMAVISDRTQAAEYLLKRGARADLEAQGRTALLAACYQGKDNMVEFLLSKGAGVNYEASLGYSPMLIGTLKDLHLKIVKKLLQRGANVFQTNKFGEGTVFHAILNDNFEVVSHLVAEDLLPSASELLEAKSERFETDALQTALLLNRMSIVTLLSDRFPKTERDLFKPLLAAGKLGTKLATSKGYENLLEFLVSSPDMSSIQEETAAALSLFNTSIDIAKFHAALQEHRKYIESFTLFGLDFDHDGYRVVPPDDEADSMKVLYDFLSWSYSKVSSTTTEKPATGADHRQPLHQHGGKN